MNPSDYLLSILSPQVNAEHVWLVCDRFQDPPRRENSVQTPQGGRFCGAGVEPAAVVIAGDPDSGDGAMQNAATSGGDEAAPGETEVVFKSRFAARWYTQIWTLLWR